MTDINSLIKLPFWDRLTDSEKELIKANSMIQKYSKGQFIYNSGNECSGLTIVLDGEF